MIKQLLLHLPSPKAALRLCIAIFGLCASFPAITQAAKPGGGTTTTMVLTYTYGAPARWVARIDPLNVKAFQLTVMFDEARAASPLLVIKNPFIDAHIVGQSPGRVQIAGTTSATSPGDVDIFELVFTDSTPAAPLEDAEFVVLASGTDFLDALDTATQQTVHFGPAEIGQTTRFVTTGVSPHIWDPDGVYNNGHNGGPGTWQDQTLVSWDDLPEPLPSPTPVPTPPPLHDTAWDNNTHANDLAIFGGDPGSGVVTVSGQIFVGGFQFDISGYHIQGGSLTLSSPPGLTPVVDTGANNAMISSPIFGGNGLTKVGTGTLALTGANTYTGTTTINAGTLFVGGSSGTGNTPVMVNNPGCILGGNGTVSGPVSVNTGGSILGGNGTLASTLTLTNNLNLNVGAMIKLALGPAGNHSTLNRVAAVGIWSFAPNQAFTIVNLGAQPVLYNNIITGLAADPGGVASWHINNPGFSGTFVYDGSGNIDLTLTSVPPALTLSNAVSRKNHGAAGSFNIPLPLSTPFGVECRSGGASGDHSLVFTFTNNVVSGNASVATVGTGSVSASPVFFNNTMTVNLTGVSNAQLVTVTLSGVMDSFSQVLPDTAVSMRVLAGDTNGNGSVSSTDVSLTKLQSGVTVTNGNFREDVVVTGTINGSDISLVKLATGTAVSKPAR